MFRTSMERAPNGMAVLDPDGRYVVVNDALCRTLGRTEAWLLEHRSVDVVHPDDLEAEVAALRAMAEGDRDSVSAERRFLRGDGDVVWTRKSISVVRDNERRPRFFIAQLYDNSSAHLAQVELAFGATHDGLTGLPNRSWMRSRLEEVVSRATSAQSSCAVLFIDLDNFKVVNDSLGHASGDEVLGIVAARLAAHTVAPLEVGRVGGDEFVVLMPQVEDASQAEQVARVLSRAVALPLEVSGHRLVPTLSVGIAVSHPGDSAEGLLRDADSAMFRAKQEGRDRWRVFDAAMHAEAVRRLRIEDELRRGLDRGEFVLHFQPVVRLADAAVTGHEALVRWQHPTLGLLAPGAFLAVAEESGLIVPLGERVTESALHAVASGRLPGTVAINVSAVQLANPDWASSFQLALDRSAVDPQRVIVEVTETAVLSHLDDVAHDLELLRSAGIGIHVDDFGTGYSSLSLLRDLPVTGLKLDRSFVTALDGDDSSSTTLAAGLAGLARGLGLAGIAEGVETPQQASRLLELGWTQAQGYLFGRPEPLPELVSPPDPAAGSSV
jgi:diguanylate cyclase (GGDEF)-like protein/PAS domain S-box-containing protein